MELPLTGFSKELRESYKYAKEQQVATTDTEYLDTENYQEKMDISKNTIPTSKTIEQMYQEQYEIDLSTKEGIEEFHSIDTFNKIIYDHIVKDDTSLKKYLNLMITGLEEGDISNSMIKKMKMKGQRSNKNYQYHTDINAFSTAAKTAKAIIESPLHFNNRKRLSIDTSLFDKEKVIDRFEEHIRESVGYHVSFLNNQELQKRLRRIGDCYGDNIFNMIRIDIAEMLVKKYVAKVIEDHYGVNIDVIYKTGKLHDMGGREQGCDYVVKYTHEGDENNMLLVDLKSKGSYNHIEEIAQVKGKWKGSPLYRPEMMNWNIDKIIQTISANIDVIKRNKTKDVLDQIEEILHDIPDDKSEKIGNFLRKIKGLKEELDVILDLAESDDITAEDIITFNKEIISTITGVQDFLSKHEEMYKSVSMLISDLDIKKIEISIPKHTTNKLFNRMTQGMKKVGPSEELYTNLTAA